ncbi:MAG: 3-deoxy-manno-octulosonate cytidylyltransferase [Chitinophagaceae bacterium]|nr:3-deoxy-manno-octulosonate cytidylyltransferase [Chitinophagaceae bacterium]
MALKKNVCLIPARYDASRFDGKLLKQLVDKKNNRTKSVIRETYERMSSYGLFDEVRVVTNSEIIRDEIEKYGGLTFFSNKYNHNSGTDRIAEAVASMDAEIIFNVQGDEPFIDRKPLEELLDLMNNDPSDLLVASLMKWLPDPKHIESSDYVKVTVSKTNRAITFSRSVVPFPKKEPGLARYYEHVGVYAFTRKALLAFAGMQPTPLERVESVECIRFQENDIPIRMVETDTFLLEIDTEEDLLRVNSLLENGTIRLV